MNTVESGVPKENPQRFPLFEIDTAKKTVKKDGETVGLNVGGFRENVMFTAITLFAKNPGLQIRTTEFRERLARELKLPSLEKPGSFSAHITTLRRLIGDSEKKIIRTHGGTKQAVYLFAADVYFKCENLMIRCPKDIPKLIERDVDYNEYDESDDVLAGNKHRTWWIEEKEGERPNYRSVRIKTTKGTTKFLPMSLEELMVFREAVKKPNDLEFTYDKLRNELYETSFSSIRNWTIEEIDRVFISVNRKIREWNIAFELDEKGVIRLVQPTDENQTITLPPYLQFVEHEDGEGLPRQRTRRPSHGKSLL